MPKFLFIVWSLGMIVDGASFFPNSTTIAITTSTSTSSLVFAATSAPVFNSSSDTADSITSIPTYPCISTIEPAHFFAEWRPSQYCSRTEQPFIDPSKSIYQNPYLAGFAGSPSEAAIVRLNYCSQRWSEALDTWLATAPVTFGSPVPVQTTFYGDTSLLPTSKWRTETFTIQVWSTSWTTSHTAITLDDTGEVVTFDLPSHSDSRSLTTATHTYKMSGDINTWAGYTPAYYQSDFTWTAPSHCCSTCSIYGGDVQVYYWPTPAPSPPTSTLVNAEGFTFISPSVYVAFRSLYASNLCGMVGEGYNATTLAFDPTALSTGPASFHYNTAAIGETLPAFPPYFRQATWGDHLVCTDVVESYWKVNPLQSTTIPGSYYTRTWTDVSPPDNTLTTVELRGVQYTITYNPCSPMLAVPTELYDLNPEWKTCNPGISGFYDPPYVLSTANGLTIPIITHDPQPVSISTSTSDPAVIRPTLSPGTATATVTATPTPTSTPNTSPVKVSNSPTQTRTNNDPPIVSQPAVFTFGSITLTPNPTSALVLGSQTLGLGSKITVSGTVLSLATDGSSLIMDGTSTQTLHNPKPTGYIIDSQTLIAGAPAITISGTLVSLAQGGESVVVGGKTEALSEYLGASPTRIVEGEYLIGGQTLRAGAPGITISGTLVSLAANGASVVVGTKTEALSDFISSEGDVGGIVWTMGGFSTEGGYTEPTATSSYMGNGGQSGQGVSNVITGDAVQRYLGIQVSTVVFVLIVMTGLWL